MDWKHLVIAIGAEWAPDGLGLEQLHITADGAFAYEHRWRGEARRVTGTIAAGALHALGDALHAGAFPAVPAHDIPPGSALMEIRVMNDAGEQRAVLDYHAAARFMGYREMRATITRWFDSLRNARDDADLQVSSRT